MEDIYFTHAKVILLDQILDDGAVITKNGVISWIGPSDNLPEFDGKELDLGGFYLSPGLIDLQVHGAAGVEVSYTDRSGLDRIVTFHEKFGTTSMCLTVLPSPLPHMKKSLHNIALFAKEVRNGARILGSNLEGPFINPHWVDISQGRWLLEADLNELKELNYASGGWLRIMTFAPELEGIDSLIKWFSKEMGLVASIGHTRATSEQSAKAIDDGARMATHLFNEMRPFHHREPNAVGAILASKDVVAQIVMDGKRVHPIAAKIAYSCLGPERFCLVTDATSVTGTTDGLGKHSGRKISLVDGVAKFSDNQVAGSALTMIDAVRNTIDMLGLDYPTAIRCASHTPAKVLGMDDRIGSIRVGNHADLLVLDKSDLRVLFSYVGGKRIFRSSI